MPRPKDIILAAVGPPRRHVAALGRLAPFVMSKDPKLRAEACKLAIEILDDYGGGTNPLPLCKTLIPPLVTLAKKGEEIALAPLADLTWVLWRADAYTELAGPAKLLAEICEAKPTAKCLARDARKGLGKGATCAREAWMYRRMLFEADIVSGKATPADEDRLRAAVSVMPPKFQLSPPYIGAEGNGDDGVTYSMLMSVQFMRRTGGDAKSQKRAQEWLWRVIERVEPELAVMRSRPRKEGKDDYATWRAIAWAEQALFAEMAGDKTTAKARLESARDVYYTYGGLGFEAYVEDVKRLKIPEFVG